jgi:F0F1-type ATP synthase beta subunit
VVSIRGCIVDVRFPQSLPEVYSLLKAGEEGSVAIEVLATPASRQIHKKISKSASLNFRQNLTTNAKLPLHKNSSILSLASRL